MRASRTIKLLKFVSLKFAEMNPTDRQPTYGTLQVYSLYKIPPQIKLSYKGDVSRKITEKI